MFHSAISTYEKSFKMGKKNLGVVHFAHFKTKISMHLFIGCNEQHEFINKFIVYHLKTLLIDIDENMFNNLRFD